MKKIKISLCTFILVMFIVKLNAQTYTWNLLTSFSGGARTAASSFSIGNKGYIMCGVDNFSNTQNDLWEYNPTNGVWTQRANIPGPTRFAACGFSVGSFGYVCLGWETYGGAPNQLNDLWQYNPSSNTWMQKTNFPAGGRYHACAFVIDNKAYVGLGYKPMQSDFYEYDATNDTWTGLTNVFPGGSLTNGTCFSITYNNGGIVTRGYVCTGSSDANGTILPNDLHEFTPGTTAGSGTWATKANFPGIGRIGAFAFSMNGKGYLGGGVNFNFNMGCSDFYEYDPVSDSWNPKSIFPGVNMANAKPFVVGNIAYVACGQNVVGNTYFDLCWNYSPVLAINSFSDDGLSIKAFSTSENSIKLIFNKPLETDYSLTITNILGEIILTGKLSVGISETTLEIRKSPFENLFYKMISEKGITIKGKVSS